LKLTATPPSVGRLFRQYEVFNISQYYGTPLYITGIAVHASTLDEMVIFYFCSLSCGIKQLLCPLEGDIVGSIAVLHMLFKRI
jgi:hypothetical protein